MAQSRPYQRSHNTSNPFQGQPSIHQSSHPQHQNFNLQHNLGGHPGFGVGPAANIFGPQTGNGGLPGAFGAAAGLGGGGAGLASHAAQTGFAYGAALQQEHGMAAANSGSFPGKNSNSRIREVWKHNLKQEFFILRQLVERYPYISMVRGRGDAECRYRKLTLDRTLNFPVLLRDRWETSLAKRAITTKLCEQTSICCA